MVLTGLALAGVALAWWLSGTFAGRPDPRTAFSAFYVIFARDEVLGLALVAAFCLGAALFIFREKDLPTPLADVPAAAPHEGLVLVTIVAGVFVVAALGTHFVCHDYALSADEYMADFQAQIFLRGNPEGEFPQWLDVRVIKPTYVDYLPEAHAWKATYLPDRAALRAIFRGVYLQSP